jgi:UDP-GlcNAc:undecaprenyl-phosphate GlcNAc-1-phosphate transferase
VGLAVSLLITPVLARLAQRVGWSDDPSSAPERKHQARPVPPVGGAAILLGLVAARGVEWLLDPTPDSFVGSPSPRLYEPALWITILLGFATGLVDDLKRGGLHPAAKLVGQTLAGLAFAHAHPPHSTAPELLTLVFIAVLAQNLVNTWDNADGAATTLGACGLSVALPYGSGFGLGAMLGFLPHNLFVRRGKVPSAYLGDSGSHLLALVLLAAGPSAWLVLWLPLLDLARLSWVRVRAGSRPWIGDRRHLAHRLEAKGLGPVAVVAVLLVLTLPLMIGVMVGTPAPGLAWYGLGASTVLFCLALFLTGDGQKER